MAPPSGSGPVDGLAPVDGTEVAAAVRRAGSDNPLLGIGLAGDDFGTPADRLCAPADPAAPAGPDALAGSGGRGNDAAAELIAAVGAGSGAAERRVAASLVVLGYSARLAGPAVSMLVREGMLLDLRPSNVRFGYDPGRGLSLALVRPAAWRGDDEALRRGWGEIVVDSHLGPVIEAVRSVVPVAAGLLWGNVASGLAGALRALASASDGAVPPGRCHAEGLLLLNRGPLRGSGELSFRSGQLRFTRRSCCLYYRLDGGGMCGDCPLLHPRRGTRRGQPQPSRRVPLSGAAGED